MMAEMAVALVGLGLTCMAAVVEIRRLRRANERMRGKLYELTLENVGLRVALRQKAIRLKQPEKWPAMDVYNKRVLQATLWLN